MQRELQCEGKVRLGELPRETGERLAQLCGSWLEFSPAEGAIVVRHVQPAGCGALSAVPCELVTLLDGLTAAERDAMPGGELIVSGPGGPILRLRAARGEVSIQWAHADFGHAAPVALERALEGLNGAETRLDGWIRYAGPPESARELESFVDRFEGLYPEGTFVPTCAEGAVEIQLEAVNAGVHELLLALRRVADRPETIEADLTVGSFAPEAHSRQFRLRVHEGRAEALRPSLWREE
jgi:hypothetical protein